MGYAISIPKAGSPDVLERIDTGTPALPAPGQVVIRNRATAVNFIDTIIRRGEMPAGAMPSLPHVPGVEGAGVVEAVGEGVERHRPGDRVCWMGAIGAGGYGTHSVVAAPYVARLAPSVELEAAAAIPVNAMTAWHMLVNLGRVEPGQSVLVHAAGGGVGTMAIQLARHLGLTVVGTASSEKLGHVREQGAHLALDYRSDDLAAALLDFMDGRGVDLTLNPVGGATLAADLDLLAPFGTAVIFGFLGGAPAGTVAETLVRHFGKSVAVRVSDIYTYFNVGPEAFGRDLARLLALHGEGILRPHIHARMPLTRAAEAHRLLEAGTVTGKLVLAIE